MPETYDLLLRGGTVIDGTGNAGFIADVAVEDGIVRAIGTLPPETQGTTTLDVTGMAVTPGFIDIHTHADISLLVHPTHLPKIMQGVTTEVFTNCGLGFAPVTGEALRIQREYIGGLFGVTAEEKKKKRKGEEESLSTLDWNWRSVAEFLQRFEQNGIGANIAYLIPHGSVRVSVMGMAEREATTEELRQMQAMVAQGMEEGAWGLSTGIWYAPMRAASREELVTLCCTAGFFATHQRDYGENILSATEESLAIAAESGARLEIAHLQMNGPQNAGRAPELLTLLDRARQSGIDITCDTYPYTAGSTFIQSLLPAWAVDGGPELILRRLSEAETRTHIVEFLNAANLDATRYNLVGATSATNAQFEGETFALIAQRRGLSIGELVCSLLQEEELRACYVHHAAHEGNVRDILQWPGQMVGSDGLHLPGKTHPRLYGTFPRVLGHYVRDERVISLEAAIHKMTGAPAARLGLKQRGTLAVGNAADIVVFNSKTIHDTATFDAPLRFLTGITYVFVNGIAAKWNDAPTGRLNGRVLRPNVF